MQRMVGVLGVWWMLLGQALAGEEQFVLIWDYPRTMAASSFRITGEAQGQTSTMTVEASEPGACVAVGQPNSPDIYCAKIGCFPPGMMFTFRVAAQQGDGWSETPESISCHVNAQCRCGAAPVVTPPSQVAVQRQPVVQVPAVPLAPP